MSRVLFIVLDGVGVGALPDAAEYDDLGSHTLGNLSRVVDLHLPNLGRLGLGNLAVIEGVPPVAQPLALPGRLATRSAGKDTTIGHWEHMGLVTARPFPTFAAGFPADLIEAFEDAIGREVLGNKAASGTAIIEELGREHLATGKPIVYTSADSVFQIAAHVDLVQLETLYKWCDIARGLLTGPTAVARVIARPFSGVPGAFIRTRDRRDYSLAPPGPTYMDALVALGIPVIALGKISEIFTARGVTLTLKVGSNDDNLNLVSRLAEGDSVGTPDGATAAFADGLLITNLVDFDTVWGHRNDVDGFAAGLGLVDAALPRLLDALRQDDLLVLTADHGVDPTTPSTDHSREYVPALLYPSPKGVPAAVYEGTLADTGATVFRHLTGRDAAAHEVSDPGNAMQDVMPSRGWRRYTPMLAATAAGTCAAPMRVGVEEAGEAAGFLAARLGSPPDLAVILGSGLLPDVRGAVTQEMPYARIPHWAVGSVPGHRYVLSVIDVRGCRIALLQGRVHEYEGFDLSEEQLPVNSLAVWGVKRLLLTSASGAVSDGLSAGDLILTSQVLDFQRPFADGRPVVLPATTAAVSRWLRDAAAAESGAPYEVGVHASLPGPNYETPAELDLLRAQGVDTVSMSPAAELRAAHQSNLRVAVAAIVANAGDTTHEEVLAGVTRAADSLTTLVSRLSSDWPTG